MGNGRANVAGAAAGKAFQQTSRQQTASMRTSSSLKHYIQKLLCHFKTPGFRFFVFYLTAHLLLGWSAAATNLNSLI